MLHRRAGARRMMKRLSAIVASDRCNSFDRFSKTTATLRRAYESAGARVEVDSVATGGCIGSGRWVIHEASDFRSATVDIVCPVRRRVLDYRTDPFHGVMWGAAMPPGGTRCEMVIVDDEAEFGRLPAGSLRGKAVLTRLDPRDHLAALCHAAAACVISDQPVPNNPDAIKWQRMGWGGIAIELGAVRLTAFVISANQGECLRSLHTDRGPLTLHVKADIRPYAGSHDVVSGVVAGRDDPQNEVWALSHTHEPGGLDNASGTAVCIEIAQVLESLIASGKLARPRRSIRLLHGFECYGFFAYIERVKRYEPPLAGVVIDSVGAKPAVCDGRLGWYATVPMSAGFVNRIGAEALRAALRIDNPGYKLGHEPFVSTCDTLVGDPQYGFPCPWLTTLRGIESPYDEYHSSADTIKLVSPRGLRLCAAAMAAYLYYLADAGTDEVMELAQAETGFFARALRRKRGGAGDYLRQQHRVSIEQMKRWLWGGDRQSIATQLQSYAQRLPGGDRRTAPKRRPRGDAARVPRRKALLSPTLENTPGPIAEKIRQSGIEHWDLFWADGQRTLAEITNAIKCEHGKEVAVADVAMFFEAHAELGYVDMIDPKEMVRRPRLVRDLRDLGLARGMDVMVHSSLSSIGHVEGGAATVIDGLLGIIGKSGTLLMPSFNHRRAKVFNPLTTPTMNGAIPDAMWRRRDAVRSLHGTHAVVAIGPRAQAYCQGHLEAGVFSQDDPVGQLIHAGGYILSLGVGHIATTAFHVAENAVPCRCNDSFGFRDRVVMPNGDVQVVPGLAFRSRQCPIDPGKLDDILNRRRRQRRGKVGKAPSTLVKAKELWKARIEQLKNHCPTCNIRPQHQVEL